MGKTKIITESAADISKIDAELYGIEVLPFSILMPDGKEYLEQVNITYDEFYAEMAKFDVPPKTAQVNQFLYEEAIEKYKDEYDNFLIITLSAASSATHENALKAKRTFEGSGLNIEVLDSGTFTGAYGVIVREIAKLNLAGADFDALLKAAKSMIENNRLYAVIDDLKYLKISGRIKPLTFTLGTILDIKPIVTIEDGLVAQKDKVRGYKKAVGKIIEKFKDITPDGDGYLVSVGCSTDNGTFGLITKNLNETFDKAEIIEGRIGATIGTHCGPGVIAVAFIKKPE